MERLSDDLYRVLIPSLAVVFAAGGLMYQVHSLAAQMHEVARQVGSNTQQITRLATQIEEQSVRVTLFWQKDWVQLERRLENLEERVHMHQSDQSRHR